MTVPDWTDHITIMQARGRRLTKMHRVDGTCADYDSAYRYNAQAVPVASVLDLLDLLRWLLPRPDRCVVRGEPIGTTANIRRLATTNTKTGDAPTLCDVPRRWLAIDWDGIARPADVPANDLGACGDIALEMMPLVFRHTLCIIQASANHGIKPGCRLRGWFWCDRPITGREIMRWLQGTPCDPSVWRPVQPIYTAAPLFAPGRVDPIRDRLFLMPGEDWLWCPPAEELADPPPQPQTPPERLARGRHAIAYVDGALTKAANAVIHACEGKRHETIIAESRSLARLVAAGLLTERDLTDVIKRAAASAGKTDEAEIVSCIAWGIANPSAAKLPEMKNAA